MSFLLTSNHTLRVLLIVGALSVASLQSEEINFCGLPNISSHDQSRFAISADFLYWYPSQEVDSIWATALSFGINTSTFGAPSFDFSWNSGFRVGIGYDFVRNDDGVAPVVHDGPDQTFSTLKECAPRHSLLF